MAKSNGKRTGRIVSVVCWVLVAVMLGAVAHMAYCNASGKVPFFFGRAFVRIVSPSMEPVIPTGTYILVEKLNEKDIDSLETGDVIMFYSRDTSSQIYGLLNTHRIAEIRSGENGREFVTKGDNNPVNDTVAVRPEDIVGRYSRNLALLTGVSGVFGDKAVFLILILIPAAALVVMCLLDVIKKSKEMKLNRMVAERVDQMKRDDENNKSGGKTDV